MNWRTFYVAQCCFWSACVFADIRPFPIGVMKGIISRHLEHWLGLPIFDNAGILTVGYAYPNLCMSEEYNAFGSPYWALKAFLVLALEDNHEFFSAEEEPLPVLDKLHIIPEADMVIQRVNGYAVVLPVGQWVEFGPIHTAEKYSKFTYSSKYAFSVPRSYHGLENAGTDSMLVFVKEGICFVRRKCRNFEVMQDGQIVSSLSPCDGIEVETTIIPTDNGHVRKHRIECGQDCTAYDCGFSIPFDGDDVSGNGEVFNIKCTPNTNLMHANTAM